MSEKRMQNCRCDYPEVWNNYEDWEDDYDEYSNNDNYSNKQYDRNKNSRDNDEYLCNCVCCRKERAKSDKCEHQSEKRPNRHRCSLCGFFKIFRC